MMTRPVSALKALGLTALYLLACPPTSTTISNNALFASAATTSSTLDSTTGGAPDAGTVTMTDDFEDPCDATPAPSAAAGAGDTPSPVVSNRCIPIATSYDDDTMTTNDTGLVPPTAATPAPSEPEATPEPTLTGGSGGGIVNEPSAAPTTMMPAAVTEAPIAGDVTDGAAPTQMPTAADESRGVGSDGTTNPATTAAPADAGTIPTTQAPTNEDGQTAGDDADGASGLAPPGAVVAAAFGLVVAAAVLAA